MAGISAKEANQTHKAQRTKTFVLQCGRRDYNVWHLAKVMWSLQEVECGFSDLLVEEIGGFEDEGRDNHVKSSQ